MKRKSLVNMHKKKTAAQSLSMNQIQNNSNYANSTPRKSLSFSQNILNITITSPTKNNVPNNPKIQLQSSLQQLLFDRDCSMQMLLIEDNIDDLITTTFQGSSRNSHNYLNQIQQGSFQQIAQEQEQSQISEQMLLSRQVYQKQYKQEQSQYPAFNSLKSIILESQNRAKFQCYTNKNRTIILNNQFNKTKTSIKSNQQILLNRLLHHLKNKNIHQQNQLGTFCQYLLNTDECLEQCIRNYFLFNGVSYNYNEFQTFKKIDISKMQSKRKIKSYFLENFIVKGSRNQNLLINKSYEVCNIWELILSCDGQTRQLICEWLILY